MNNPELEPTAEVAHLRRLLDIQPGCLMRLGADGTVLAANDAALTLLGVTSGAQALGRDFEAWIPPDQRDRWRAFATGVAQGHPASVECDITAPAGDRHTSLFHGVPLPGHPDGVASMAVAARAVSSQRLLEAAVVELEEQLRERDAEGLEARARLAEGEACRRQLEETVAALEARLLEREAGSAELEEQLRERDAEGLEARARLAEGEARRRQLEETVAALEARLREREADSVELDEQLRKRDAEGLEARARLADAEASRRRLEETAAALEARLREREANSDEQAGQLRQLRADLAARDGALAAADAARRAADANCTRALADVRQLEMALEAFAARQQKMTAELAAERQRVLQMSESLVASREQASMDARNAAEWDRLTTRLEEREAAVRALEVAGAAAQAELEEARGGRLRLDAALQEAQQAFAMLEQREQGLRAQRDALQVRLDQVLVTCQERESALSRLETAHGNLAAAHAAATAEHDRLVSALREHALHLETLASGAPRFGGGQGAAGWPAVLRASREEGQS